MHGLKGKNEEKLRKKRGEIEEKLRKIEEQFKAIDNITLYVI
jgi:hypothetical protein